jgi:serine/threonine-protein kinase
VYGLVLELLDGGTLAERIRNPASGRVRSGGPGATPGPARASGLPLDEALRIASQIADALDAAHEKGIVHRDLKPANVAIAGSGAVKVLDFGLAKLAPVPQMHERPAVSVTATFEATREGLVMGTAAYMSPEQANGDSVDKRTDIWAFGCLLYEMLAGRAPFARATTAETLSAILNDEPDWDALPRATPDRVRRLIRRCLEKDARRRIRDIGDARAELEDSRPSEAPAAARGIAVRRRLPAWVLAGAGLAAGIGVGALLWASRDRGSIAAPTVTRSTVTLPSSHELDTGDAAGPLAISPSGRRLVFAAAGKGRTQLFVRRLDAFGAEPIAGTDGAQYPFFSPDGESVAFFADRRLKRVSLQGGSPVTICDTPVVGRGGTWGRDGTIVFDPGAQGLSRVRADGGQPEPLVSGDPSMDQKDLSWPQFMPDGRGLLVTVGRTGSVQTEIAVLSLATGDWRVLGRGSQAQFLPPGHLIYHAHSVREGELHALAFDAETLSPRGAPVSVLDGVFRAPDAGAVYFAVAQNGTLTFTPGGYARSLVLVDRHGRRTPLLDERSGFRHPAVSPDGQRVAVTIDPRPSQIWVYDVARKSRLALATDDHNLSPLWSQDGRRILYTSGGPPDIFSRAADAGTPAERLLTREGPQYPTAWTADGQLIFHDGVPNGYDIWILPPGGTPRPLIVTAASELGARLSPDGRWLAYHSNESGRFEVYVRPFPNVNDGKWTISTSGGQQAQWSRDSGELFYAIGSSIMSVRVGSRGSALDAGRPELLFSGPFDTSYTNYTMSHDGTRFVMIEVDPEARPTFLHVVMNWATEVERLAGVPRP